MSKNRREVRVIVDLQFGSTGKGLIAGYLAEDQPCDTVVAAWRPNAGHTYIDKLGRKFVHTMIPNGIVSPTLQRIMIGPEAAINPAALAQELVNAEAFLGDSFISRLYIHEHAAIVEDRHREDEKGFSRIGSTMKGSAEAVIEKMRRDPNGRATAGQNRDALGYLLSGRVISTESYDRILDLGRVIQVEGAQGFSLGINQRFYPYCTSRECTATQVLSDCAIPRSFGNVRVIGTLRTFPIRVANRFGKICKECGNTLEGHAGHYDAQADIRAHAFAPEMIGTSGPYYPDQIETTFEVIGQPVELTTVTKLPRRVFTFSETQLRDAVRANAPDVLFLNFMNYLPRETWVDVIGRVSDLSKDAGGGTVAYIGKGPTHNDVEEW